MADRPNFQTWFAAIELKSFLIVAIHLFLDDKNERLFEWDHVFNS